MHFKDLNWMKVDDYLKGDDRVILVLGSCEQHGYLSLLTDTNIPMALADAASEKSGVLVAPPLNFGCSPYFLDYPGTVSLRLHTYLDVVKDILCSLYGAGFRKILLLNGHDGNVPIKTFSVELLNELPDLRLNWYSWWATQTAADIAKNHNLQTGHASWFEAFEFNKVVELPQEDKCAPTKGAEILSKKRTRAIYGDGMFGSNYEADPAVMQEMFDACLKDILALLDFD